MKRTLVGAFLASLCACGSVPKQKADAGVDAAVDAAPDAFNCTAFPLSGNFTYSPAPPTVNQPVTFTPAVPGISYAWTFTDGMPGM
ncbi:MAG TPA: hypothetical protein VLT45_05295, partial [Kofleriaceae bacterium]|nr:hypothetical protein [Kofleriaceae bacterium]